MSVVVGDGGEALELVTVDEAPPVRDLLDSSNSQAMAVLDCLDVVVPLDQGVGRTGVEPGEPPAKTLDAELAAAEGLAVDVGVLRKATGGWKSPLI